MTSNVAICRRQEFKDYFMIELVDDNHLTHTVLIPSYVLTVEPKNFLRGSDLQHLDTLACGAVMMRTDVDAIFHRVDREMVDRAYEAALRVQFFDRLKPESVTSSATRG